jgi:hypothetical protein
MVNGLEHDPEKHALGRRPDGCAAVLRKESRSIKNLERDDDRALGVVLFLRANVGRLAASALRTSLTGGPPQHPPPKRPLGLIAPAVDDIVTEQFVVAAAPACDAPALEACVVELVAEAPERLVDADDVVAAPVVDPAEGIVVVGTANGSEPQLGAPNMKPTSALDAEQNVMPPELPFVPPDRFPLEPEEEDGLDGVVGTEVTILPRAGPVCAELVWA